MIYRLQTVSGFRLAAITLAGFLPPTPKKKAATPGIRMDSTARGGINSPLRTYLQDFSGWRTNRGWSTWRPSSVLAEVAHLTATSCGKDDDELTPVTNIVAAGIQS